MKNFVWFNGCSRLELLVIKCAKNRSFHPVSNYIDQMIVSDWHLLTSQWCSQEALRSGEAGHLIQKLCHTHTQKVSIWFFFFFFSSFQFNLFKMFQQQRNELQIPNFFILCKFYLSARQTCTCLHKNITMAQ